MFISNKSDSTAKFLSNLSALKPVFNFLKNTDLSALELGKHDISDGIFANVQEYDTKEEKLGRWESHKKYIDFQYVISGQERIKTTSSSKLTLKDDELDKKDALYYEKYQGSTSLIELHQDDFGVFLPEDAHEACLNLDTVSHVKKAVIKIPFALLF
ncbi:YhcH/YjgK/YiaL family protein [Companilactobacillus jidongensis]|uniref:YhcH/YjgK/YiaL family protein n=1 Tax=Companilactobacillus jidongensis TaxID=2486006 RepID=UPI000F785D4C|nr:YhcH/YjgK/YiaL family protein [Companilactobacillus jidongensis]